ncbi:DUF6765 family protein [Pseudomonas xanthosomatis]|uniref:DUF6765 family protein n=1 Tax=Pseudomonas xanthosomatis TaxID=2842356 RepID=UPI003517AE69
MDQDFHFYGTFHSAMSGGFDRDDATLIAKAANFIDFFSESTYASYWSLVTNTSRSANYNVVAKMDNPRYTYQGGLLGTMAGPEDGLWCSYHFIPGNYNDPAGTPTREEIHGTAVANYLPKHIKRDTFGGEYILKKYNPGKVGDLQYGRMLNRPQSALSRRLIQDALLCARDDTRLEKILSLALGGEAILKAERADVLRRFRLILLGVRAHVIADTWAHQDHCGLDNVMNTYWDADYDPDSWNPSKMGYGRQSIYYQDGASEQWKNQVLSSMSSANFEAAPSGTSYLGHGWLGHFPDYSFARFRYKPCWSDPKQTVERDNPKEYEAAWVELTSLFCQAKTGKPLLLDERIKQDISKARQAIASPCNLSKSMTGRKSSEHAWRLAFSEKPVAEIDVDREPDANAVLDGMVEISTSIHRFGVSHVNVQSDLYLFQIAADYHFQFVKHYLQANDIYHFTSSWSQQRSTLSHDIVQLFE